MLNARAMWSQGRSHAGSYGSSHGGSYGGSCRSHGGAERGSKKARADPDYVPSARCGGGGGGGSTKRRTAPPDLSTTSGDVGTSYGGWGEASGDEGGAFGPAAEPSWRSEGDQCRHQWLPEGEHAGGTDQSCEGRENMPATRTNRVRGGRISGGAQLARPSAGSGAGECGGAGARGVTESGREAATKRGIGE
eukprot:8219444-Pyramimonas_sp.AAC.1